MSLYSESGQETIYRDGKLVGFNSGYGYCDQHNLQYLGPEQRQMIENTDNPVFKGEIIGNPRAIKMIQFSDGNVLITNDNDEYRRIVNLPEEEKDKQKRKMIDNSTLEVVSQWYPKNDGGNDGFFILISTNEHSSEMLKELFYEMQKGNVAISSDYRFIFKNRGLSFLVVDQLTKEELDHKQSFDQSYEMKEKLQQEYRIYLKEQGVLGDGVGSRKSQPTVEIWNLQTLDFTENEQGEVTPIFYLEIFDTSKGKDYLDPIRMYEISQLTGDEIKALIPIIKSQKYVEYAKGHSTEETEKYLIEQLEQYRETTVLYDKEAIKGIAVKQRGDKVDKIKQKLVSDIFPDKPRS